MHAIETGPLPREVAQSERAAFGTLGTVFLLTAIVVCAGMLSWLSIARYLAEWVRHGYWSNRYERQARRFVALRLPALRKHLARNFHTMRRDPETP